MTGTGGVGAGFEDGGSGLDFLWYLDMDLWIVASAGISYSDTAGKGLEVGITSIDRPA